MTKAILVVGEDDSLLRTRALILRRPFSTVDTCQMAQARAQLELRGYDLIVICYSVDSRVAIDFIREVKRDYPSVKTLHLVTPMTAPEEQLADATVEVSYRPMDWLSSLQQLIQA